ncbi:MAG TPA: hypothetical protein QF353_06895 [Gammaproteobacteria bacterium]|nr:hypothetical protein [Gammaproteobacteria bacterium]
MSKNYRRNKEGNGWIDDTSQEGVTITYYDNKDTVYEYANGHQSHYLSNGDTQEHYPNGIITKTTAASAEKETFYPDGSQVIEKINPGNRQKVINKLDQSQITPKEIDTIKDPKKKFKAAQEAIARKWGQR